MHSFRVVMYWYGDNGNADLKIGGPTEATVAARLDQTPIDKRSPPTIDSPTQLARPREREDVAWLLPPDFWNWSQAHLVSQSSPKDPRNQRERGVQDPPVSGQGALPRG